MAAGGTIYGVNTGFGKLARTRIGDADLATLQRNLILSHCTGSGPDLDAEVVRLVLALKVIGLARGYSGVRREIVAMLAALLRHGVLPCVPAKGSVGASGDLTPLAHLSAILIGVGEATHGGRRMPASGSAGRGRPRADRARPEGGAGADQRHAGVDGAGARRRCSRPRTCSPRRSSPAPCRVEAREGSSVPFDARIHEVRGHRGQIDVAAAFRALLARSGISGRSTGTGTGCRTRTRSAASRR